MREARHLALNGTAAFRVGEENGATHSLCDRNSGELGVAACGVRGPAGNGTRRTRALPGKQYAAKERLNCGRVATLAADPRAFKPSGKMVQTAGEIL